LEDTIFLQCLIFNFSKTKMKRQLKFVTYETKTKVEDRKLKIITEDKKSEVRNFSSIFTKFDFFL
jgi:hypothetical protein